MKPLSAGQQAEVMQGLLKTEAWQEYARVLSEMILIREQIIGVPLHERHDLMGMDFAGRAGAIESVKGALIGLKLARDLPQAIINAMKDTRPANDEGDEPDA